MTAAAEAADHEGQRIVWQHFLDHDRSTDPHRAARRAHYQAQIDYHTEQRDYYLSIESARLKDIGPRALG